MNGRLPDAMFPVLDGYAVNGQELGYVGLEEMSFQAAVFEVITQCFRLGLSHLRAFPAVGMDRSSSLYVQVAKRQSMAAPPCI